LKNSILSTLLILSFFISSCIGFATAHDVKFIAGELLGRPTDKSVTVKAIPDVDVEVFFEYETESSVYVDCTDTLTFPKETPIEMVMDKLRPNTRYYYRMRYRQPGATDFDAGAEHSFHTQRARGSTFSFAIQADSHLYDKKCNTELYQRTLQNIGADAPDFLLDLGDTFGNDHDTTMSLQDIFQLYLDQRYFFDMICHSIPLFLCLGNHEVEYGCYMNGTAENIAVYATEARKFYYLNPFPDLFYSGNTTVEDFVGVPENYYAWEWGDALFVVLDAYRYLTTDPKPREWDWTLGEQQYDWFKETLDNRRAKFKFVFIHHVLGQTRGGVIWADKFEWGGKNQQGDWEFDQKRHGWVKPIHQLMVDNGVTIFFQGHDHLFAKEELDGVIYQEVPMPSDATYNVGAEWEPYYASGIVLKNSGHLLVTVSDKDVKVDYVRAYLPGDETPQHPNGEVAYSYSVDAAVTFAPAKKSFAVLPKKTQLLQNFPNPFNPDTRVVFFIPSEEDATLKIYNAVGQEIRTLLDSHLNTGEYIIPWDGLDRHGWKVGSGIYFIELQTHDFRDLKKAILLQ
jgi:hypothetical protein